jgi:DNA-binding response OmpR family regulator
MQKENRQPYYYLERTANVLLVDDDQAVLKSLEGALQSLRFFTVQTATSTRKALTFFERGERIHLCVFDLGLTDVKDDEFYLLRAYRRLAPFVVLTGSPSAEKGFTAGKLGAKSVIQKGGQFSVGKFLKTVNHHLLLHIINPRFNPEATDSLTVSTTTLFDKSPAFVTDWAIEMGITDRELRYIWKKNLGANSKIILFVYHVYRHAFAYMERCFADGPHDGNGADPGVDNDEYRRMEEYYHLHRSTICDYLAYGNVVNVMS